MVQADREDQPNGPERTERGWPWPWRGAAWVVAALSVVVARGATVVDIEPDPLIVEYFREWPYGSPFLALWALSIINAFPIAGFLMGARFWWKERATGEYRFQAILIMAISGVSGVVVAWQILTTAWALAGH